MMLMTGNVEQHCRGSSIDPIHDHRQRRQRRVLVDLLRDEAPAEV